MILQILGIIFIIGGLSSHSFSGVVGIVFGIVLCLAGSQGKRDARKKEIDQAVRKAMDKQGRK